MKVSAVVQVTEEHIKRGMRKKPNYCPVAIATLEAVAGELQEHVYPYAWDASLECHVLRNGRAHMYKWRLPEDVQRFMYHFDAGREVSPPDPFKIEFDLPEG